MAETNMARMRAKEQSFSPDMLRALVHYDPQTGIFTSLTTRGRCGRWPAGRRMGALMASGYRALSFNGVFFYEHRAAFAWMTGKWPEQEIDHKDLDRSNNQWDNLREATHIQNTRNHPGHPKTRLSKYKGVQGYKNGWRAVITVNRKTCHLGVFASEEDAHTAYANASCLLHGEYGRTGDS